MVAAQAALGKRESWLTRTVVARVRVLRQAWGRWGVVWVVVGSKELEKRVVRKGREVVVVEFVGVRCRG